MTAQLTMPRVSTPLHLLTLDELGTDRFSAILDLSARIKRDPQLVRNALAGGSVGMIFQKPSTRTRISFEVAAWRLGMMPIALRPDELQLGRGETIADTARTMSRYLDAVTIRTYAQREVEELAAAASIPVINALTDEHHPCQGVADTLTLREEFGGVRGLRLAFVGDGDNVATSLIQAAALGGFEVHLATPAGYEPAEAVVAAARKRARATGAAISLTHDPIEAVRDADAVYADVWTSMGRDAEREARLAAFAGYTVTKELMSWAKPSAIFLHCLPAHRGEEVTDEVMDGPQSRVWNQAENRLHTEIALLYALITGDFEGERLV